MHSNKWWLPLIGLVFTACLAASFALTGQPPSANEDSPAELVRHHIENGDKLRIGVYLGGVAVVLFVYFWSYIRTRLEAAAGENGFLARVMWAGVIVFIAGVAVDLSLELAMVEGAGEVSSGAIQTLQAYWDNDFVPMAVGLVLLHSATALSTLLHGGLPRWLGWLSALIAVVGVTPWGFVAFPATGVWIILASVALAIADRKAAQ